MCQTNAEGDALNRIAYATGFGTSFGSGIQKILATRAISQSNKRRSIKTSPVGP